VSEKLDSERIFLFLLKSSGGFHVPVARNRDRENISNAAQKVSHYAVQRVVEDGKTLFVQEAQKDRRYRVEEDLHGGRRALSVLVLPLKVRGELRGGIYADHRFQTLADRTLDPEVEHLVEIAELSVQMRDQRDLLLQLERSLKTRHAELETPMELAPEGNRRRDATFLPLLEGEGEAEVFHGMLTANPDMRDTFDKVRASFSVMSAGRLPAPRETGRDYSYRQAEARSFSTRSRK
jgi:transcriptional regulator with GAF, ATPase, and Fis domain